MTKIVRHRSASVDSLRDRLKALLGKPKRRECPTCAGSGHVNTPLTPAEVADSIGIGKPALSQFIAGKGGLSLERGLQLLAWLDEAEHNPLAEADAEHQPKAPVFAEQRATSARREQLDAASRAGSNAAIDAMHRPLQLREPR